MSARPSTIITFLVLVILAAGGRLLEPLWCFTPMAAVAMFSGFYFRDLRIAALVPLAAMAFSDVFLPAYDGVAVALAVYGAFLLPLFLGRRLQKHEWSLRPLAYSLLPATVFFLTTNLAIWMFRPWYEPNLAGLVECYTAAIPFFRWMLMGDLFYVAAIFGVYALATDFNWAPRRKKALARVTAERRD
ncbi:MAG: hypothetical protein KDA42_07910 [Planctomycetales bacterium]|nr:hypothetical protein [Planctomycetales bacterium]